MIYIAGMKEMTRKVLRIWLHYGGIILHHKTSKYAQSITYLASSNLKCY
jgi:hypothetical protein